MLDRAQSRDECGPRPKLHPRERTLQELQHSDKDGAVPSVRLRLIGLVLMYLLVSRSVITRRITVSEFV